MIYRKPRRIRRKRDCFYCKQKTEPDYKDVESFAKFVSERGKINSRLYSGVCQKHQRILSSAIKRARFLALIPFLVRPE